MRSINAKDAAAAGNSNVHKAAIAANRNRGIVLPPSATATIMADAPLAISDCLLPGLADGGDEGNPPRTEFVVDGEGSSPPTDMVEATLDTNSFVAGIDQDSHGENVEPPPAAMNGSRVEVIEDKDGPIIPPSMSAMLFDGDLPDLDATRTAASRYVGKSANARGPEVIQDNTGPPTPLSITEFADSKNIEPILASDIGHEEDVLKKGQPPLQQQLVREDSLVIPTSEEMESEVVQISTNRRGGRAEEFIVNANISPLNPGVHRHEDIEADVQNGNPEDTSTRPDFDRVSTFRVLEAVLVDDVVEDVVEDVNDELYMGTLVEPPAEPLPLWKLKQVTIALVCVSAIAAAIALGIALSTRSSNPPLRSVVPSNAPSTPSTETCYWITIAITYDKEPEETIWRLDRAVDDVWDAVKEHAASEGDTSYSESICLEEGEYRFSIFDNWPSEDGICCDNGEGIYSVTVDEALIVEGGEFGSRERTEFTLPFVPGTNVTNTD